MKRLLKGAAWAVAIATVVTLVGLEVWYRSLLPGRLPEKGRPMPEVVRSCLLSDLRAGRVSPAAAVARVHYFALLDSGELPREKTYRFHLREVALAIWVARHWTESESLDAYGASAWLGAEPYGFEPAAQRLFAKRLGELDTAEAALLVGLLQNPRRLDPACHPERASEARSRVLDRLAKDGRLAQGELLRLKARPLGTVSTCPEADIPTRSGTSES